MALKTKEPNIIIKIEATSQIKHKIKIAKLIINQKQYSNKFEVSFKRILPDMAQMYANFEIM